MQKSDERQLAELTGRIYRLEKELAEMKKQQSAIALAVGVPNPDTETAKPSVQAAPAQTASVQATPLQAAPAQTASVQATPLQAAPAQTASVQATPLHAAPAQTASVQATPLHAAPAQTAPNRPVSASNRSVEGKIGKTVMSILASVLIFLGLSMFGVIIFKVIDNFMKSVILLAVSSFFTCFGLIKMKKDSRYYVFFTSLSSCGLGAFYLTFMLMHFEFELFSTVGLCIALALWTVATAVLSRCKAKIFTYICYAGTAVSTIVCSVQWRGEPVSLIFYYLSLMLLFLLHREKNYGSSAFYFIQFPVMSILLMALNGWNHPIILFVIMTISIAALVAQNLCLKPQAKDMPILMVTTILTVASVVTGISIMSAQGSDESLCQLLFIVIMIGLTLLYCIKYRENSMRVLYYVLFYITAATGAILYSDLTFVFYVPLLALGLLMKKRYLRYTGYAFLLIGILFAEQSRFAEITGAGTFTSLVAFTAISVAMFCFNFWLEDVIDKYIITGFILLLLSKIIDCNCLTGTVSYAIFALIAIFMCTKAYAEIGEDKALYSGISIPGIILKIIMMCVGIVLLTKDNENLVILKEIENTEIISAVIIITVTLAVFIKNTGKMFAAAAKKPAIGVLICLKFSIFILACLLKLETVNYVISVAGLLTAIACISVGFVLKHKEFRVYGLVLSLLCVAKLILFDISYNSVLLRPIGFVVAGILCFAISWIYSRLEKKIQ